MRRFVVFTTVLVALFVELSWRGTVLSAAELAIQSQSATAGTSFLAPIVLTSQGSSISAIQFDVGFDSSAMGVGGILGSGASNAGKGISSAALSAGSKRFLIAGLNQTAIPDGSLVNLFVNVSPVAPGSVYALTLANVTATDAFGQAVAITPGNGTLTLQGTSGLQAAGVRNAAGWLAGPVAPGEIVTLVGANIGPATGQFPPGAASASTLGGVGVSFDGTSAPLLYAGPDQINAVVPYGVSGKAATQLQVSKAGQSVASLSVPVAPAAPGIFSIDSSGVGPGAILNQDMSANSEINPAARGSVIVIYATGAGQTSPAGVDGALTGVVAGTVLSNPLLSVSVQIGGINSSVQYAGAAPGLISGALQVNAVVPDSVSPGTSVPVLVTIGTVTSQAGITIAVR